MQENICDLSLDGRKLLGLKLWELIQRLRADQAHDMTFAVAGRRQARFPLCAGFGEGIRPNHGVEAGR